MKFNVKRTFGVEIEFAFTNFESEADEITYLTKYLSKNQVEISDMGGDDCPHWRLDSDTSCGWELKSPILQGEEGLAEIKKVVDLLAIYPKIKVTDKCGLHVHHYGGDLSARQGFQLLHLYMLNEGIIDFLVADWRRGRENMFYADSLVPLWWKYSLDPIRSLTSKQQATLTWRELLGEMGESYTIHPIFSITSRYLKVNLRSLLTHHTVEFRQLEGTLDSQHILDWIVFTQLFVERAASGTQITSKVGNDWGNLMRRLQVVGAQCEWDPRTQNSLRRLAERYRKEQKAERS